MNTQRRGLGRGLSSLIGSVDIASQYHGNSDEIRQVPIEKLQANPEQPRRSFSEDSLKELASSIADQGVIQPILARPDPSDVSSYQIVAGERRWRAAQLVPLSEVPVIIRDLSNKDSLATALIENLQRADLNSVEEATAYNNLAQKHGFKQRELANAVGKSRAHIANTLRLLNLPESVQKLVREGALSAGHARALLSAEHPARLADIAVARGLSVRQVEELVRKEARGGETNRRRTSRKSADTRLLESTLSANLDTKVSINVGRSGGSGKLIIQFDSMDQFHSLYQNMIEAAKLRNQNV